MKLPIRWIVVSVFLLSSSLNYLDRQILAALAPILKAEFHLSNEDYGGILAIFSITYAIASPVAGWFLDKFGLTWGMSAAVAFWSVAGMARGFTGGLSGMIGATAALGVGEAAGIPGTAKVGAIYLEPKERAFGSALSQIGLSIGSIGAPLLATWLAIHHGWRSAFIIPGLLGFVWIPLWLWMEKRAPKNAAVSLSEAIPIATLLRKKQMWGFIVGNIFSMFVYTLWTNWTTIFLTTQHRLSMEDANKLAPVPHFFAYFGSLAGGALAYRLIGRGMEPLKARRRVLLICALCILSTALVPLMPTPLTATLMISTSFFFASGWGVNYYNMPVDAYGARAAFAVSLLTMAYGVLQIFVSPLIGRTIDLLGFTPVCTVAALTPLAGYAIVMFTREKA